MPNYKEFLTTLPDGTIRQRNPFNGLEVWTVPGRSGKPTTNTPASVIQRLERKEPEDYCDLCETRYFNTPPERERVIKQDQGYTSLLALRAGELSRSKPLFRRMPNLFEIVTFDYWRENFGLVLSPENKHRKEAYLSDEKGHAHLINVIDLKLKRLGKDPSQVTEKEKRFMTDAFFGGGHEMIVAGKHFVPGSWPEPKLYSSGELTPDEHFQFFKFTVRGIDSCYNSNPYVKYVAVFQNWLRLAGASFDHLHKQIVAVDKCGANINGLLELARKNPNIFNQMGPEMAAALHLLIAENNHAMAFSDIGNMHPTVTIQSKSEKAEPCRMNGEELRGMSDLVHAIHHAIGSSVPCNEEWYYTPRGSDVLMPWRVCIRQRINTPAGFEGVTGIYISPIDPLSLRNHLVRHLQDAKRRGTVAESIFLQEKGD